MQSWKTTPQLIWCHSEVTALRRAGAQYIAHKLMHALPDNGLVLSVRTNASPFAYPHFLHLSMQDDCWQGALLARLDESLPFVDGAFDMIVLDFVLDALPHKRQILAEAARVLSDDGTLIVLGLHAISIWMLWQAGKSRRWPTLQLPAALTTRMHRFDIVKRSIWRYGAIWPGGTTLASAWLGGAYVWIGQKQQQVPIILSKHMKQRQALQHPSSHVTTGAQHQRQHD